MTDVNPASAAMSKIRSTQRSLLISCEAAGAAADKPTGQAGDEPASRLTT
jgi:hypothetical protein